MQTLFSSHFDLVALKFLENMFYLSALSYLDLEDIAVLLETFVVTFSDSAKIRFHTKD